MCKVAVMDYRILDLFIKENDAWDHMINRQRVELPQLNALINHMVEDGKDQLQQEHTRIFEHLRKEMAAQQLTMELLSEELAVQQTRLAQERRRHMEDVLASKTLDSQKILRNRIRDVEKRFVELKCNYLNYVATI